MRRVAGLLIALLVALGIAGLMIPRGSAAPPAFAGTVMRGKPAPTFRLRDQTGHTVSLARFRGHPIIVTFLEARCREVCPLVADKLREALQELGPASRQVVTLAISTDPEGDTPAAVRQFSREHGMLGRWHYLTAGRAALAQVWRAYYIFAAPPSAPPAERDAHTSATYLLDRNGREQVLMGGDPDLGNLVRDLRILTGLPLSAPGESAVPAPQVGHPAPAFALRSLTGTTVRLSSFRHRAVLLNFWATWCTACRSEMPRLARWYRQLRSRGFVVLGIDQQEAAADARAFVRKYRVPYPILLDQSGTLSARYDVAGLPTTYLLDGNGIIRFAQPGILNESVYRVHLEPLLRGRSHG